MDNWNEIKIQRTRILQKIQKRQKEVLFRKICSIVIIRMSNKIDFKQKNSYIKKNKNFILFAGYNE